MTIEAKFSIGELVTYADKELAKKRGSGKVKGVCVTTMDDKRDSSIFVDFKSIGRKWVNEELLVKA